MKKVYARQIPPEHQESPLFLGDEFFPDDVAVFGNRNYNEHCPPVFDRVYSVLYEGELLDAWDEQREGRGYKTWADALNDLVPPEGREPYTREERKHKWPDLLAKFWGAKSKEYNAIYCEALELITGKKWLHGKIRGNCQGDWQDIIYPAEKGQDWLKWFEIEYFNTGSEWMVHDEEDEPESPEEISGFTVYCHGWSDEEIRAEIAETAGENPADVVLYGFDGWTQIARYAER